MWDNEGGTEYLVVNWHKTLQLSEAEDELHVDADSDSESDSSEAIDKAHGELSNFPIIPGIILILRCTDYSQNYLGIIGAGLM